MASHFEEIGAAVRLFPWQDRLKHPLEYLAFLWRRLRVFDRGISAVELDEAEYRLSRTRTGSRYSDDKLAGEIALLRSLLSAHDVEMLWNGHDMALKLLKGPSRLFSADRSWTFGNPHFSLFAVREAGGFEQLAPRVASASETLSALSNRNFISLDVAFRMERHLERGETNAAHALLPELESQGDADMQALILAAFSRARLSLADGQVARAIDPLERLISRVHRLDSFELSTSLDLALGYVYADIGRVDDIPLWIRAGNVFSLPYGATVRSPIAAVVYAKTLLKGHQ